MTPAEKILAGTHAVVTPFRTGDQTAQSVADELAARPFVAQTPDEITAQRVPQAVQNMLYGLAVMHASPNVGKSALQVDMLAHVAADAPYCGRKVRGGPVVIFAAEAPFSIVQRAQATIREKFGDKRLPLYIVRTSPQLGDETIGDDELERVIATVEAVSAKEGARVRVVAFDTVACVLAGSNENAEGMLGLVARAQRLVARTGTCALLLHHPSKADPDGLRGHTSLPAAADVIIAVTADAATGVRRAVVTKSRDGEVGAEFFFRLTPVIQPGTDEFGDPITTVITEPADAPPRKAAARGANQQKALTAVREYCRAHPDALMIDAAEMRDIMTAHGIGRARRPEVLQFLCVAGVLTPSVGGHALNREALV
jgi:hypothetical protein